MRKKTNLLLMILTCCFVMINSFAQITDIGTYQLTTQAQPQNASKSMNLRGHQHHAILSHKGYQYAAFYTINGDNQTRRFVNIGRRKLPNGAWEIIKFNDYTQTRNDSHNVISLGICEGDGTIHMIFDQHNGSVPLKYRVSSEGLATNPQNHNWTASKFGNVLEALPGTTPNTAANKQFTYPRFISAPNGNLQLIRRHGSAISGASHIYTYNKDSHRWKHHGEFIDGRAVLYTKPDTGKKTKLGPYPNGANYHNGRLHVTWIWRTEGTSSNNNFDFMYAYSDDFGITWRNTKGDIAGSAGRPMTYKNPVPVKVFDFPEGFGLTNQTGQTVDEEGRVHVYQTRNVSGGGRRFSHLFLNTEGVWIKNETSIRSQRGKITHDSEGAVYAIHKSGSFLKATAASNFTDWVSVRSDNTYAGEAQYDEFRMETDGVLSMLVAKPGSSKEMFSIDFKVGESVENQLPEIGFNIPTEDLQVEEGYRLTIDVNAVDPDGSIQKVELFINDNFIRVERGAPYEWGHTNSPNPDELNGLGIGEHVVRVVATDNRGGTNEASFTLTVQPSLGVSEIKEQQMVLPFPNPSFDGMFYFNTSQEWSVINALGSKIKEGKGTRIDLSSETKGLFFVKINQTVHKIIKQ